jgi:hypothetical protein
LWFKISLNKKLVRPPPPPSQSINQEWDCISAIPTVQEAERRRITVSMKEASMGKNARPYLKSNFYKTG